MGVALLAAPLSKANTIGLEIIANGQTVWDQIPLINLTGQETFNTFGIAVDGWSISVTAETFPALGEGTLSSPSMDISSIDASTSAGGTLQIIFAGNDYNPASGGVAMSLNGASSGNVSGTYSAYYNTANKVTLPVSSTETGLGGTLIDTATWSGSPINVLAYGTIGAVGPYSLTQDIKITSSGASRVSFDANLSGAAVPQTPVDDSNVPDGGMTLTMLGIAMLGLAAIRSKFGTKS